MVRREGALNAVRRQRSVLVDAAGVVDQHVEARMIALDFSREPPNVSLRREIAEVGRGICSCPRLDRRQRARRARSVTADDDRVRALCGELDCRLQTNSAGGARDEDGLPVDV